MNASRTTSRTHPGVQLLRLLAIVLATASFGCAFGEIRPGDPFDRQLSSIARNIATRP